MPISIKIPTMETERLMYDPMGAFQTNTQYSTLCVRGSHPSESTKYLKSILSGSLAPVAQNTKLSISS